MQQSACTIEPYATVRCLVLDVEVSMDLSVWDIALGVGDVGLGAAGRSKANTKTNSNNHQERHNHKVVSSKVVIARSEG